MTTTAAIEKLPYDYSIVVPVYNSENSIAELVNQCANALSEFKVQFVLVNDESTDQSWEVIKSLKADYPNLTAINFDANAGQHAATFCGFMFAEGRHIVTIDDDLQVDPQEIHKLITCAKEEHADVVYGIYESKQHNPIRNTGSKTVGFLLHRFASTPTIGSSFKLIHKDVINEVVKHNHQNIYLDELIGWHTKKTAFTHVKHDERKHGKSGYSFWKLLQMTTHLFVNYTALPLKFITYLGIMSALISFGFAIYYLYMKYSFGAEIGFTSIIVALFFSTGLILFSLGIIGEYLSKIFLLQTGKPGFKIKSVLR